MLKDPQLDATGHVDMFMKLVNENTMLVGQYDPDETDYQVLEDNAQLLANATNGAGDPWNIIRIRQPDAYYDSFVFPVVRTYTSSLLVNNVVLLPVYGIDDDTEAIRTYSCPSRNLLASPEGRQSWMPKSPGAFPKSRILKVTSVAVTLAAASSTITHGYPRISQGIILETVVGPRSDFIHKVKVDITGILNHINA